MYNRLKILKEKCNNSDFEYFIIRIVDEKRNIFLYINIKGRKQDIYALKQYDGTTPFDVPNFMDWCTNRKIKCTALLAKKTISGIITKHKINKHFKKNNLLLSEDLLSSWAFIQTCTEEDLNNPANQRILIQTEELIDEIV